MYIRKYTILQVVDTAMFLCEKVVTRKALCVRATKHNTDHSVFQLNNKSPTIKVKDVKDALEITRKMTPYERLRYFRQSGIHYQRAMQYIKTVEKFNDTFNKSKSTDLPLPIHQSRYDSRFAVEIVENDEDERFPNDSSHRLAKMIADAARPKDKDTFNFANLPERSKHSSCCQASLSIGAMFVVLMILKFFLEHN